MKDDDTRGLCRVMRRIDLNFGQILRENRRGTKRRGKKMYTKEKNGKESRGDKTIKPRDDQA